MFSCIFTDINECTEHVSGCSQECVNNNGSYTCSCYTGYTLNSNGKKCDGTDQTLFCMNMYNSSYARYEWVLDW